MNNRFKFRVYNNKQNKWVHGPGNEVNLFGETILLGGFMQNVPTAELNDCVALQYTGLTDKNGNLIFEGDIVQYNQNSSYDNMNFIAKWSDNQLGFIFQSNSGEQLVNQMPHLNRFKHLEVVGNIFENSELLK